MSQPKNQLFGCDICRILGGHNPNVTAQKHTFLAVSQRDPYLAQPESPEASKTKFAARRRLQVRELAEFRNSRAHKFRNAAMMMAVMATATFGTLRVRELLGAAEPRLQVRELAGFRNSRVRKFRSAAMVMAVMMATTFGTPRAREPLGVAEPRAWLWNFVVIPAVPFWELADRSGPPFWEPRWPLRGLSDGL